MIPRALEKCKPLCPSCGNELLVPQIANHHDQDAAKRGPLEMTVKCLSCDELARAVFIRVQQ